MFWQVDPKTQSDPHLHGRDSRAASRRLRCLTRAVFCLALCFCLPSFSRAQLQRYECSADAAAAAACAELRGLDRDGLPGLTVSPDRRWILYSQFEQVESDLMLVENFRWLAVGTSFRRMRLLPEVVQGA